jgi:hypothetical protein
MENLPNLDAEIEEKRENAEREGKVLVFVVCKYFSRVT